MSWDYKDGHFYVNEAGNSIVYLEQNPCRCCPTSVMVEIKSPIHRKPSSHTMYLGDNGFKSLEEYIKYKTLIRLE